MNKFKTRSLGKIIGSDIVDRSDLAERSYEGIILLEMIEVSKGVLNFYMHVNVKSDKELIFLENVKCKYDCKDAQTKQIYYSVIYKNVKDILKTVQIEDLIKGRVNFDNITDFNSDSK